MSASDERISFGGSSGSALVSVGGTAWTRARRNASNWRYRRVTRQLRSGRSLQTRRRLYHCAASDDDCTHSTRTSKTSDDGTGSLSAAGGGVAALFGASALSGGRAAMVGWLLLARGASPVALLLLAALGALTLDTVELGLRD